MANPNDGQKSASMDLLRLLNVEKRPVTCSAMPPSVLLAEIAEIVMARQKTKLAGAETTAPDFFPLEFLDTRERGLSRIIAWLLDPHGSHAQGSRFLSAFTRWLDLDDAWRTDVDAAKVMIEAPTSASGRSGYVDILVRVGNRTLAIENKPKAIDQEGQVRRYLSDLATRRLDEYCVLYLSGTGEGPSARSIKTSALDVAVADGSLKIRGYDALTAWLESCLELCRAPSVGFMLDAILKHIRKEFGGVSDVKEAIALASDICGSQNKLEAALALFEAEATVHEQLMALLTEKVGAAVRSKRGWRVLRDDLGRTKYSSLVIGLSPHASIGFGIQFDKNDHGGLFYGVRSLDNRSLPRNVKPVLKELMGAKAGTAGWPVWKYFGPNDRFFPMARDVDRDFWLATQSGKLASLLIAYAEEVERVLGERKLLTTVRTRKLTKD